MPNIMYPYNVGATQNPSGDTCNCSWIPVNGIGASTDRAQKPSDGPISKGLRDAAKLSLANSSFILPNQMRISKFSSVFLENPISGSTMTHQGKGDTSTGEEGDEMCREAAREGMGEATEESALGDEWEKGVSELKSA
ncbi:hypothetical protein Droror1_Dr00008276 [Drosera rotundifolia]